MLGSESPDTLREQMKRFHDPRVTHFYDANRITGKIFARTLALKTTYAWDIYLFFDATSVWSKNPPLPVDWVHQLTKGPPDRFYMGNALTNQLKSITKRLLDASKQPLSR